MQIDLDLAGARMSYAEREAVLAKLAGYKIDSSREVFSLPVACFFPEGVSDIAPIAC